MAPSLENITVTVPEGTSHHGDSRLLCTPASWKEVLLFYAANYAAHALTIKARPGERFLETCIVALMALIYPYSGVMRGLEAIIRHSALCFREHGLQRAVRAGALCVVVRSDEWELGSKGNGKISCTIQESSDDRFNSCDERNDEEATRNLDSGPVPASWGVELPSDFHDGINNPIVGSRVVHGMRKMPTGYQLAILPYNAVVEPNIDTSHQDSSVPRALYRTSEISVSSSYNAVKTIVSIAQVVFSSVTLYNARGDQLRQYGYAAFSLTVVPYLVMSIVNLLGNLSTADFPAIYLVHSPELDEAKAQGGEFDGVIGTVVPVEPEGAEYKVEPSLHEGYLLRPYPGADMKNTTSVQVSTNQQSNLFGYFAQPLKSFSSFSVLLAALSFFLKTFQDNIIKRGDLEKHLLKTTQTPSTRIIIPACTPFQRTVSTSWNRKSAGLCMLFGSSILFAIPFIVIGALTGFDPAHSTRAQRVWTMGWLAFGLLGIFAPILKSQLASTGAVKGERGSFSTQASQTMAILGYSPFAIGGFVVVGQMLVQYGSCSRLED